MAAVGQKVKKRSATRLLEQNGKGALSAGQSKLSTGGVPAERIAPSSAELLFAPALIAWQRVHGRHDLPWQNTRDAYRIWLSEIMLQQTQVASVIPYYQRFLQKFPSDAALAAAAPEEVLGLWAGLGYYARARNLHRCAQKVAAEFGGRFPTAADELVTLPGIGRSTAAAIAVFSSGARVAILDGNVKRVLCRCFGIEGFPGRPAVERQLWALAERLLPADGVEAYTQGLMDLGASLCGRSKPRCGECPFAGFCVAKRDGRTAELPTAKPRQEVPQRFSQVLLLVDQGKVLLAARPPVGIWGGLWALPELLDAETPAAGARRLGCEVSDWSEMPSLRHSFTHFRLDLTAHRGAVRSVTPVLREHDDLRWLALAEMATAPLPAPVFKLLSELVAPSR